MELWKLDRARLPQVGISKQNVVRRGTMADTPALEALIKAFYPAGSLINHRQVIRGLFRDGATCFVAERHGAIVAMVWIADWVNTRTATKRTLEIQRCAVAEEVRGQGIIAVLNAYAIRRFDPYDTCDFVAQVHLDNDSSRRAFEKMGFRRIGVLETRSVFGMCFRRLRDCDKTS